MAFSKILTKVIQNSFNKKPEEIVKTTVPLNLHQGSMIELPIVDLALAEVDGGLVKYPAGQQIVSAVGKYTLWGKTIYNCYFSNQQTFVRLVCDNDNVVSAKVWAVRSEIVPTTKEDWEFWLGSWKKDEEGNFIRNENGIAIKQEYGLIGWPQFQADTVPPTIYNRSWEPENTNGIDPVQYVETIVDSVGNSSIVKHEAMEYNRTLSDSKIPIIESLLVTAAQSKEGASVNVFIGLTLDHKNLKILNS